MQNSVWNINEGDGQVAVSEDGFHTFTLCHLREAVLQLSFCLSFFFFLLKVNISTFFGAPFPFPSCPGGGPASVFSFRLKKEAAPRP